MAGYSPSRIAVTVDSDLKDLVAGYLKNRHHDVETLRTSLHKGDFETLRIIGHSMKGSGGGYGFDRITELGAALEQEAKKYNGSALAALTEELSGYLNRLEIVYG